MDQVNRSGIKAAGHFEGMVYWTYNWRKNGGSARMYEISKREEFYQQEYCGCVYSLRDCLMLSKVTVSAGGVVINRQADDFGSQSKWDIMVFA